MTKMNPWWDTFQGQYSHVSDIPFLVAWKWTVILQNHLRARPRSEPARNNLNRRIHLWRLCEKRLESSWTTIPHNMFILEHFVSRRPLQFNLVSPSGTQCDFPEDANIIIIKNHSDTWYVWIFQSKIMFPFLVIFQVLGILSSEHYSPDRWSRINTHSSLQNVVIGKITGPIREIWVENIWKYIWHSILSQTRGIPDCTKNCHQCSLFFFVYIESYRLKTQ